MPRYTGFFSGDVESDSPYSLSPITGYIFSIVELHSPEEPSATLSITIDSRKDPCLPSGRYHYLQKRRRSDADGPGLHCHHWRWAGGLDGSL
jgi:hypothetical protein